uniref:Carboxypeptidase n=1 Tax=Kalanchoe fedtschenkoi TaxID=63787 RepID=A0A7N0TU37_KALFE
MASTLFTSSLLIFLVLQSSAITLSDAQTSFSEDFIRNQAERLIRSFNLSPSKSINIVRNKATEPAEKFVETKFRFPGLAANSTNGSIDDDLGHHAGYIRIKHSYDARMFYYFFVSRGSRNDPVVLWLTGGPGCTGNIALFYENGPFQINDDLSLKWNDFGWDKASNLLYVDQPTGTGFSYSSDRRDIRHDETGVSNDLYDFLQAFFDTHPEFVKNDFYITGESYAGHYIPALASRVHKGNKAKEGIHINLKGLAIGNGLTDSEYQYPAYADFALTNKLISKSDHDYLIQIANPKCVKLTQQCPIFIRVCSQYYDIRKQCDGDLCYDFSNLEKFMRLDSIKKALSVEGIEFVTCSNIVHRAMTNDWMKDCEVMIPALLEDGIKVLIYAGEYDLICNWLGNYKWVNAMKWSGQRNFSKANITSYKVGGEEAGQLKSFGPLSFLKVHKAGHMVPMDQPNVSLEMLKRWMKTSAGKILA